MKDSFGREITYLRLSITDKCNLRCRYCMPEEGVCKQSHFDMLSEDEMITAVEVAASLGITKLRITGGEPLVKKNVLSICQRAAKVEGIKEVCITTNGTMLADRDDSSNADADSQPTMAERLRAAGVSRVNISLDTLDAEKYKKITRWGELKDALAGIDAALAAGFEKVKINAVLIGGFNDDEIRELCELTLSKPLDVRFIELMPMKDNEDFGQNSYIKGDEVLKKVPEAILVEADGGVAKLYRLPGALGNIGVISPISSHFCGECNRLRLTADGKIKPCLHSDDEYVIKGLDRDGMGREMERAILSKPAWHGEMSATSRTSTHRSMNEIGG